MKPEECGESCDETEFPKSRATLLCASEILGRRVPFAEMANELVPNDISAVNVPVGRRRSAG